MTTEGNSNRNSYGNRYGNRNGQCESGIDGSGLA
jgi:hypothetical protein